MATEHRSIQPTIDRDARPGVTRRTVLAGTAWAVPAIALTAGTPAYAASMDTTVTVNAPGGWVPAAGGVAVTASVARANSPLAGAPVSFTGPTGSSFSPAVATTQSSGQATTTFDLADTWAAPGSTVTVSAVSSGASGSGAFTVRGANVLAAGDGTTSLTQEALVFPSPVVGAAAAYESTDMGQPDSSSYRMVVLEDGSVWATGANSAGQLGDGTTTARSTWAPVAGVSGAIAIALGSAASYALLSDGTVLAWGRNSNGQAGQGTTTTVLTPTKIAGLTGVTAIRAGARGAYALLSDGTVRVWGGGANGRLGTGDTADRLTPVPVPGLTNVVQIACGYRSGYALLADGTVQAWGGNERGQRGDGVTGDRATPGPVAGLSGVRITAIASALDSAFALASDGRVYGWGRGGSSGNNASGIQTTPSLIAGLTGVVAISGQYLAGFALLADGTVKGWGYADKGGFATGDTGSRLTPTTIPGLSGHVVATLPADSTSGQRTQFVLNDVRVSLTAPDGEVPAAGAVTVSAVVVDTIGTTRAGRSVAFSGPSGATFSPTTAVTDASGVATTSMDVGNPWAAPGSAVSVSASTPGAAVSASFTVRGANLLTAGEISTTPRQEDLAFVSPVVGAASSYETNDLNAPSSESFQVVVLEDGTVWATGSNSLGQLGDGTTTARSTWARVPGVSGAVAVTAGLGSVCALLADGTVVSWGANDSGKGGRGSDGGILTPGAIPGLTAVTQLNSGINSVYALRSDGTVWAWGKGETGRLGLGDETDHAAPQQIPGISSARRIASTYRGGYALLQDGTLLSWGGNERGQLGDGTTTRRFTPGPVQGLGGVSVTAIAAGYTTAFALATTGQVYGWGAAWGSGNVSSSDQLVPAAIAGLSDVTSMTARMYSFFTRSSDGTIRALGQNPTGQLGLGDTADRARPTVVSALAGKDIALPADSARARRMQFIVA